MGGRVRIMFYGLPSAEDFNRPPGYQSLGRRLGHPQGTLGHRYQACQTGWQLPPSARKLQSLYEVTRECAPTHEVSSCSFSEPKLRFQSRLIILECFQLKANLISLLRQGKRHQRRPNSSHILEAFGRVSLQQGGCP